METWETVSALTFASPSLGKSQAQHNGCEWLSANPRKIFTKTGLSYVLEKDQPKQQKNTL